MDSTRDVMALAKRARPHGLMTWRHCCDRRRYCQRRHRHRHRRLCNL